MKRNILFIINNMGSGGAQRQLTYLINSLNQEEYNLTLLLLSCKNNDERYFIDELKDGINIVDYTHNIKMLTLYRVWGFIKNENIDIVYNFLETANLIGSTIAKAIKGSNIVIINSIRGTSKLSFKYIAIWSYFADYIVANSYRAKEILIKNYKIPSRKVIVIHNGVEHKNIKNRNTKRSGYIYVGNKRLKVNNKKVIISVARIAKIKNQLDILKAITFLSGNFVVLLVGRISDLDYYNDLTMFMKDNNITNVYFVGEVRNVVPYYINADCMVLSSIMEGFPNVILEALKYNIPIVASDVGDVRIILNEIPHGYLYDIGNIVQLVRLIKKACMIGETEEKRMAQYSKSMINRYSIEKMVKMTSDLFNVSNS